MSKHFYVAEQPSTEGCECFLYLDDDVLTPISEAVGDSDIELLVRVFGDLYGDVIVGPSEAIELSLLLRETASELKEPASIWMHTLSMLSEAAGKAGYYFQAIAD